MLKLEGSITDPWVAELNRAVQECSNGPGKLQLDLSEVGYVNASGAELLGRLLAQNVEIRGCSGFVAELLQGGTNDRNG